jgi:hypothetical protein
VIFSYFFFNHIDEMELYHDAKVRSTLAGFTEMGLSTLAACQSCR